MGSNETNDLGKTLLVGLFTDRGVHWFRTQNVVRGIVQPIRTEKPRKHRMALLTLYRLRTCFSGMLGFGGEVWAPHNRLFAETLFWVVPEKTFRFSRILPVCSWLVPPK